MRYFTFIFLVIIGMIMFAGQAIYQDDKEQNITRDIYDYTDNELHWNYSCGDIEQTYYNHTNKNISKYIKPTRIKNIACKSADWLGYTMFETAKYAIEYGYSNPEYDLSFFIDYGIYIIIFLILIQMIPLIFLCIPPMLALGYLLCVGIYSIYKKVIRCQKKKKKKK